MAFDQMSSVKIDQQILPNQRIKLLLESIDSPVASKRIQLIKFLSLPSESSNIAVFEASDSSLWIEAVCDLSYLALYHFLHQ
jgi:hypothetical protein